MFKHGSNFYFEIILIILILSSNCVSDFYYKGNLYETDIMKLSTLLNEENGKPFKVYYFSNSLSTIYDFKYKGLKVEPFPILKVRNTY
jgi:hypothetical protein